MNRKSAVVVVVVAVCKLDCYCRRRRRRKGKATGKRAAQKMGRKCNSESDSKTANRQRNQRDLRARDCSLATLCTLEAIFCSVVFFCVCVCVCVYLWLTEYSSNNNKLALFVTTCLTACLPACRLPGRRIEGQDSVTV